MEKIMVFFWCLNLSLDLGIHIILGNTNEKGENSPRPFGFSLIPFFKDFSETKMVVSPIVSMYGCSGNVSWVMEFLAGLFKISEIFV